MELRVKQFLPGCADGNYHVKAKGAIAASLYWADEKGPLPDWQCFACFPIEPNGIGMYKMVGKRAIPREATHVLAKAVSADFENVEQASVLIPMPGDRKNPAQGQRFLVMTDLHLSKKPWKVRKALFQGRDYDAVLICGDLTNDGTQEQLELVWQCIEEVLPGVPVFACTGNHDYPASPLPGIQEGICDYFALQQKLLDRARELGVNCRQDASGAYVAELGDAEIIGLNAASRCRHLEFPVNMQDKWSRYPFARNDQLRWLMFHLLESKAKRHIILCHGPLAEHRPYKTETEPPYFSNDTVLQRIVDVQRTEVIFLSGHTHVSMNCREGCVEMAERNHLYINAGSIRPTTLLPEEPLQPECWTEGNVVALLTGEKETEVAGISMKTGQKISRGYYRFRRQIPEDNCEK